MSTATIVTPGHRIGTTAEFSSGTGTYTKRGYIYASLVGELLTSAATTNSSSSAPRPKQIALVRPITTTTNTTSSTTTSSGIAKVPAATDIILGKVTRVTSQSVNIDITHLNSHNIASASFKGLLRKQDAGAFTRPVHSNSTTATTTLAAAQAIPTGDVHLIEMYRPGDVVRATVLSLGDSKAYYLSCVGDEYGVVEAYSSSSSSEGHASKKQKMIPISWVEMADPASGARESRKCAKPDKVSKQ